MLMAAGSLVASALAIAAAFGSNKQKLESFEERLKIVESRLFSEHFVTMSQFKDTIEALKEAQNEFRSDLKQILAILSNK